LLVLLLAFGAQVNWYSLLTSIDDPDVRSPQKPATHPQMTALSTNIQDQSLGTRTNRLAESDNRQFLLKQYDTAITEIQMRLTQESQLFALRFSLVGAILALLFSDYLLQVIRVQRTNNSVQKQLGLHFFNSIPACCFCWAAVITSALIDNRVNHHGDFLTALGRWIAEYAEPALLNKDYKGWEQYLSTSGVFSSKFYAILQLNTKLPTLVLFGVTVLSFSWRAFQSDNDTVSDQLKQVCRIAAAVCFGVFALHAYHFYYKQPWGLLPAGFFWVAGSMLCWRLWGPERTSDPAAAAK